MTVGLKFWSGDYLDADCRPRIRDPFSDGRFCATIDVGGSAMCSICQSRSCSWSVSDSRSQYLSIASRSSARGCFTLTTTDVGTTGGLAPVRAAIWLHPL